MQSEDVFYLLSGTESAGSPPRRVPPPIAMNQKMNKRDSVETHNFPEPKYPAAERSHLSTQQSGINCQEHTVPSLHDKFIRAVGLPSLKTGTDVSYCMIILRQLNIVST